MRFSGTSHLQVLKRVLGHAPACYVLAVAIASLLEAFVLPIVSLKSRAINSGDGQARDEVLAQIICKL